MSNFSNSCHYSYNPSFRADLSSAPAVIAKPIEKVENVTNNIIDSFTPSKKNEEKKNADKIAVKVGSTVLVLGALVALLNPKTSGKMINKLKAAAKDAGNKAKTDKSWKGKVYRGSEHVFDKLAKMLQFVNNANSIKDESFQLLCTKKKNFSSIQNKTMRNILEKMDAAFRKIMCTPHRAITKTFDKISKYTVQKNLKSANKEMNRLENLLNTYKDKLNSTDKQKFEQLIKEISSSRNYYTKEQLAQRLEAQEKLMENLEKDTVAKLKPYMKGLFKKAAWKDNFKQGTEFWAESILKPQRNQLEKHGEEQIVKLVGNEGTSKGKYDEIVDLLAPYLEKNEKAGLDVAIKKVSKKLHKANKCECIEYFDKKRDLMLGSAPTDVLSAITAIGLSGIAIGTADDKEQRISRAVTLAFPAIAGLGASLALTAMLFSGGQSIAYGALTSAGLSKLGSMADKHLISRTHNKDNEQV